MKAKRAKQYRKLMQQYGLTFGLREPYQVIVDAGMIQDADRFKMDLVKALERTLGAKVKPSTSSATVQCPREDVGVLTPDTVITQCSIRHLYDAQPKNEAHIATAKTLERRRCGHHTLETPLSTLSCLTSVVDPKDAGINKYNYVIASQDDEVRAHMRSLAGVPLIYVKRSIMILEPMAGKSSDVRTREERGKFRAGIARAVGRGGGVLGKRGREDDVEEDGGRKDEVREEESERKRKKKGPKEPNPLSMKKKKVREPSREQNQATAPVKAVATGSQPSEQQELNTEVTSITNGAEGEVVKKKRKRKHKTSSAVEAAGSAAAAGEISDG
jgi:U3 small nucleolar RNA-associated protein 23